LIDPSWTRLALDFILAYWPYLSIAGLAAISAGMYRRLQASEMSSSAEKEQTFFLVILYIFMKSGKTVLTAFREAAMRKRYIKHLSDVSSFLVRESEKKTLAEGLRSYVHPSREFTLLLGSLGEDLESGFGVVEKVEKLIEQAISRESDRWRRYVDSVETLGEVVVSVILLIPLIYVVGGLLGGFPLIYSVVIAVAAAAVLYVVSSASEPLHLIDLPRNIVVISTAVIFVFGGVLAMSLLGFMPVLLGMVAGFATLVWGLFVHFRYVRRAVAEGEAAFLLLDGVAARLRAGYPLGRSLEAVVDPRYKRYAHSIAHGLEITPLNRFMALAMETVKVARLGGLGAEALSLLARLALTIYLSFTGARARMKLYTALAIASGAAIVAVSAITLTPFTGLPAEVSSEIQRLVAVPSIEPVLPLAMLVSYVLGVTVGRIEDQTVAACWRAGAGVIATLMVYSIASAFV